MPETRLGILLYSQDRIAGSYFNYWQNTHFKLPFYWLIAHCLSSQSKDGYQSYLKVKTVVTEENRPHNPSLSAPGPTLPSW